MNCCNEEKKEVQSCHPKKKRFDYILWISLAIIAPFYALELFYGDELEEHSSLKHFAMSVFELLNRMWWGLALGIFFVGILSKVPREFVISILGQGGGIKGILRATLAGTMLDLCSHGILFVGMKLYERGASLGQLMAFLIASPWNSFSLTIILWSLIGFKWMMLFLVLSLVIAIISGLIFEALVKAGALPDNPNKADLPDDFRFMGEAKTRFKAANFNAGFFGDMLKSSLVESRMILR